MYIFKKNFLFFCLCLSALSFQAQHSEAFSILNNRGELYFSFFEPNKSLYPSLSQIISIDKIDTSGTLYAYANRKEFEAFLLKNYPYKTLIKKTKEINSSISMAAVIEEMDSWDKYPTYAVYLALMDRFQKEYPTLCKIDTMGYSVEGKLLLAAHITNFNHAIPKPGFLYSSTLHGDEIAGFVLMLRLIDHLLSLYGEDELVTQIINETDLYINPNANPDGSYFLSDTDLADAKRFNANFVDLNRNFPNHVFSSKNTMQPENKALIDYISKKNLVISASLHGGAEVVNIPWDVFTSDVRRPQDSIWWVNSARIFVDTCRKYAHSAYMTDTDNSGVIYGADWYPVRGGRQDYMLTSHQTREFTIEISKIKLLPASQLPELWETCFRSFLQLIGTANKGFQGVVYDAVTKQPLKAHVIVEKHDDQESSVYSSSVNGYFFRPIQPGKFNLGFYADGYQPYFSNDIDLIETQKIWIPIELALLNKDHFLKIAPNPTKGRIRISCDENILALKISDLSGSLIYAVENIQKTVLEIGLENLSPQIYILQVQTLTQKYTEKLIKL